VTVEHEQQRSGFLDVTGPAIVVYPAGVGQSWNAGHCCGPANEADVDDVGFLTAVMHQVVTSQPDAAADQVYLAGYSNGGKMALRMACANPQLLAGVAVYGAVDALGCQRPAPLSLLEIASTGDPEVTIGPGGPQHVVHGYLEPTVFDQVAQYRQANGCGEQVTTGVDGTLTSTTWVGCRRGRRVGLAVYQGGGHGWPTGDATTPSAEDVIWRFFESLRRASG
jgi:polyhydroxybutyrate depolymerase